MNKKSEQEFLEEKGMEDSMEFKSGISLRCKKWRWECTLPKTNSSPLKMGHAAWKQSSSNHPFSDSFAVSFREFSMNSLKDIEK